MKLFYRKYGEGPPLIILHGLYGSSDNWVSVAKTISTRFTVFLPDLRNHGQSPHNPIHDYNSMSSDIHELSEELGLGKYFLAGHSMGGKAAIFHAVKWPENLLGLLIADISPFALRGIKTPEYYHHREILQTIIQTNVSEAVKRDDIKLLLAEKISSPAVRGFIMKNLQRRPDGGFEWKINAPVLLKNLENIMDGLPGPVENQLSVTGFPVLFLKGERSDYIDDNDRINIMKLFPSAEVKTVKNAGHWIHTDNPDAIISAFISLLDD